MLKRKSFLEEIEEIRKSIDCEVLEKARDTSKLVQKPITDKNGVQRKVWVRPGEESKEERTKKVEPETSKKPSSVSTSTPTTKPKTVVGDFVSFTTPSGTEIKGAEVIKTGTTGVQAQKDGIVYKVKYENIENSISKNVNILMDKSFVQQGWRGGSDGLQPKSFDTIEGLYKGVESVRQEFLDISKSVVERFKELKSNLLTRKTLKGEDRIKEKLREDAKELKEEGGNPALLYDEKTDTYHCRTIRDCDGHTLCLNSLEDVSKVMQFYNNQDYVIQMKNKFARPSPVGYSDINMNIKLSNGAIVEMQLNTTANMVAKERYGHSLYEVYRSIESNPKYKELAELMGVAQKKLYGLANKYSKDGNYPEVPNGNIFDKNYKHEPYANSIRDYVQKSLPLFEQAKKEGMLNKKTIEHFEHLVEYIK